MALVAHTRGGPVIWLVPLISESITLTARSLASCVQLVILGSSPWSIWTLLCVRRSRYRYGTENYHVGQVGADSDHWVRSWRERSARFGWGNVQDGNAVLPEDEGGKRVFVSICLRRSWRPSGNKAGSMECEMVVAMGKDSTYAEESKKVNISANKQQLNESTCL
ncbi:hypothetical protein K439DRAFT_1621945 [Ramaria rubella]|nr:hypothetical protein K439DRAFT_1621945 [Ramaria rubella]